MNRSLHGLRYSIFTNTPRAELQVLNGITGGRHSLEVAQKYSSSFSGRSLESNILTRISDLAVVLYRQDQSPRLDFWGSDVREPYYGG